MAVDDRTNRESKTIINAQNHRSVAGGAISLSLAANWETEMERGLYYYIVFITVEYRAK